MKHGEVIREHDGGEWLDVYWNGVTVCIVRYLWNADYPELVRRRNELLAAITSAFKTA